MSPSRVARNATSPSRPRSGRTAFPVTLDLEQAGLEGDIWELTPGYHHLVWDSAKAGFDVQALTDFSVTATPVEDAAARRAWLVFDVATGRYDYLGEEAAPDGG